MTIVLGDTIEAVLAAIYAQERGDDDVRICPRPRSLALAGTVFGPLSVKGPDHPCRSLFPGTNGDINVETLSKTAAEASEGFRQVAKDAGIPYAGALDRPVAALTDRRTRLLVGLYPEGTRLLRDDEDPESAAERNPDPATLVPTSVPSTASIAFAAALLGKLDRTGVTILDETPLRVEPASRRINLVTNRRTHEASRLIFAPGKFTRLGIATSPRIRCRLLKAPVVLHDRVEERIDGARHFARSLGGPHPAHRIGLRVDGNLAILDRDGDPLHPALLAAGEIVAGFDSIRDKGAFALLTAHLAAGKQ